MTSSLRGSDDIIAIKRLLKLEKSFTYARNYYYYNINSTTFPEELLHARHLGDALGKQRPTGEPQCHPRGKHSLMEEDRPAITHRRTSDSTEGSVGTAGA